MAERETAALEEIIRVNPRVGRTERARARWAINFAQERDLTPGDWSNRQREFIAFAVLAGRPERSGEFRASELRPRADLPPREFLQDVQARWRTLFESIRTKLREGAPSKILSQPPIGYQCEIIIEPGRSRTRELWKVDPADDRSLATLKLFRLLGPYAYLLRECSEQDCQRIFLANRRAQAFCSRRCQNRATIRAWRAARRAKNDAKGPRPRARRRR